MKRMGSFLYAIVLMTGYPSHADIHIAYDSQNPPIQFAVSRLQEAAAARGERLVSHDLSEATPPMDLEVVVDPDPTASALKPEGFQLQRPLDRSGLRLLARDAAGAMYGVLDLAEQFRLKGSLSSLSVKTQNPRFPFRAVKFNLPWSPYRAAGPTPLHLSVCRDLEFWKRFLDQMAENRFNALTLWNLHPFTYMIRPANFPEACPFNESEMADWKRFWSELFRLAKDRGIETYIVNWNIVVSPEFAQAYGVKEKNDTSDLVRRYTRECVTQLINEYPDLSGLGVTLADWMNDMTPADRENWIEETFVEGMKAASRPVKFIHRSVLAGSPAELRRVIDSAQQAGLPTPVQVEVKFNWSHGHSTPRLAITHDYETGQIDEGFWNPEPTNFKIAWMIRNEDFFILRWGDPDFIREHIRTNGHPYVDGYFVGSEGSIPAADFSHAPSSHQTWQFAFEKQWLFYTLWGRLLYDPNTPDSAFAAAMDKRCGDGIGRDLLRAYALASRMPLRLASFHAATWDYTLYSEGFLAPAKSRGLHDDVSPFISILEFIDHHTLDPTYLSILDFVQKTQSQEILPENLVTPLELADACEKDSEEVFRLLRRLEPRIGPFSGSLACELLDAEAWSELSLYMAEKLRAGVTLQTFRVTGDEEQRSQAVRHLQKALFFWDEVIRVTQSHYRPAPHVYAEMAEWAALSPSRGGMGMVSWEAMRPEVERDIELARSAERAVEVQ